MADGRLSPAPILLDNVNRVDALDALELPAGLSVTLLEWRAAGSSGSGGVTPAQFALVGRRVKEWDGIFFEVIHVIPRTKDVGNVVSATDFEVEVWDANYGPHYCDSLVVNGPAGVEVIAGPTMPHWWGPFCSVFFTVRVLGVGDPRIYNLLVWDFPGYSGTDCLVTGLRVILFGWSPNGDVVESFGYLTRVLQAWDGTEQRALMRSRPDRELKFDTMFGTPHAAANAAARLYVNGRNPFTVPFWPDLSPLNAPVAIGAEVVMVATAGRAFEAGKACVLWRDADTWEAVTVLEVQADRLVLDSPTTRAWATLGSFCVPALVGRMLTDPVMRRANGHMAELSAAFSVEPV
jgi:hypothetical protein